MFGQLSEQYAARVVFVKVDVDECEDVSGEYGVQAMPTFVFVKDGAEVDGSRVQGANVKALTGKLALLTDEMDVSRSQAA